MGAAVCSKYPPDNVQQSFCRVCTMRDRRKVPRLGSRTRRFCFLQ
jgi:hypothetical protein